MTKFLICYKIRGDNVEDWAVLNYDAYGKYSFPKEAPPKNFMNMEILSLAKLDEYTSNLNVKELKVMVEKGAIEMKALVQ